MNQPAEVATVSQILETLRTHCGRAEVNGPDGVGLIAHRCSGCGVQASADGGRTAGLALVPAVEHPQQIRFARRRQLPETRHDGGGKGRSLNAVGTRAEQGSERREAALPTHTVGALFRQHEFEIARLVARHPADGERQLAQGAVWHADDQLAQCHAMGDRQSGHETLPRGNALSGPD